MANLDDAISLLASPPAAGESCFDVLCHALLVGLDCNWAGVARLNADGESVRLLAARTGRAPVDRFAYALAGTPCGEVYGADPSGPQLIVPDGLSDTCYSSYS